MGILGLQVELFLIRLVDMVFKWMFSYPHCGYTGPAGGASSNQTGGHGFQVHVLILVQFKLFYVFQLCITFLITLFAYISNGGGGGLKNLEKLWCDMVQKIKRKLVTTGLDTNELLYYL